MDVSKSTILITGGATGIGQALSQRLARAGSQVILCGRRREALEEAREAIPNAAVYVCDLSNETERTTFARELGEKHPHLNVIINNAGIQHRFDVMASESWARQKQEITINLEAPIHLTLLLLPHLQKQKKASVVNVTSGLSFSPLAEAPIYSATKAALHSFTLSLRHQLRESSVEVIEIIPPAVNTDLGGKGLHDFGAPLDEFADAVFVKLKTGALEIAYGSAAQASQASRAQLDEMFKKMNGPQG